MSQSDTDALKAANLAYYRALSARDIGAMREVWSRAADNILIAPPVNPQTYLGWEAIEKNWEGYWPRFSEFSVTMQTTSISINGPVAWVHGIETSQRRSRSGEATHSTNLGINIFVYQAGRWLMVFHQSVAMR